MDAMNTVLSPEVARQITRGRTPLLPQEYEEAIRALTACTTLDEAKYWNTKADVYAAWSKIFHSDEVMRKAKVLKLHAQRRMSQLAQQLRARKPGPGGGGAVQYLMKEHGFKRHQAEEIRAVGNASQKDFDRAVSSPKPPSARYFKNRGNAESVRLDTVYNFARFCERVPPEDLVEQIGNRTLLAKAAKTISDWIDSLEQQLRKRKE